LISNDLKRKYFSKNFIFSKKNETFEEKKPKKERVKTRQPDRNGSVQTRKEKAQNTSQLIACPPAHRENIALFGRWFNNRVGKQGRKGRLCHTI